MAAKVKAPCKRECRVSGSCLIGVGNTNVMSHWALQNAGDTFCRLGEGLL